MLFYYYFVITSINLIFGFKGKMVKNWAPDKAMRSISMYTKVILSVIMFIIGILFMTDIFIPTVEHIKQDAWIRQNSSEPAIAGLMFIFTSKGGFFTGQPIHVKIQMWLTEGENYTDIAIVFPDAYAYPRNQTPGKPPSAPWICLKEDGDRIGEGDIEFTSPGSYGYIIFSEGQPVYYAADQKTIEISPYENFLQVRYSLYGLGLTLISIAVSILAIPAIREKRRKGTNERKRQKVDLLKSKLNYVITSWETFKKTEEMHVNPGLRDFQYELESNARSLREIASALEKLVSENALKETIEIADMLTKLSEMKFYINGGRSWNAFLQLGDEAIKKCKELSQRLD